jgi:hypothetical protein
MSDSCEEPNPLGDEILFFSSDGSENYLKISQESREKNDGEDILKNIMEANILNVQNDLRNSDYLSKKNIINYNDDGSINIKIKALPKDITNNTNGNGKNEEKKNDEKEGLFTIRQHQKFLISYKKEAEELSEQYADRLRMAVKIGKMFFFFF